MVSLRLERVRFGDGSQTNATFDRRRDERLVQRSFEVFNVKRHVGWTYLRARRLTKVNNVGTNEFSFVAFGEFGLRTQGRL
ncbi:MAG: hypothetical protein ACTS80_01730 [Candidatus Hodgkinia cicadicola]